MKRLLLGRTKQMFVDYNFIFVGTTIVITYK